MKYTYFINEITVLFVQIYLQNYKTYQTMCVKKMRKSIFSAQFLSLVMG